MRSSGMRSIVIASSSGPTAWLPPRSTRSSREEQVRVLIAEPGRVEELRELDEAARPVADLLLELAAGGLLGRLAVDVALAGRDLEDVVADRGAELADHDDVVAVDRHDDDRAGMVHDGATELLAVRRLDQLVR